MADFQSHSEDGETPMPIKKNNKEAIDLTKNKGLMRAKHINVQLYFVKDKLEKGVIKLEYCPSKDMLTDGLTKPLPGPAFLEHRERINLHGINRMDELAA
jgi:hypothetical protein